MGARSEIQTTPEIGVELEVQIERILPGGVGLAHANGGTLFVSLAAPGDVVRVTIEQVRGKVAFAAIKEIIRASAVRVEPPCPYFGRCGGCDFQQISYAAQLETKAEIIRDCLRRLGGIKELPEITVMPAPSPWHYRARAEWQFDPVTQSLGYYRRNSRQVCDVAECGVLVPPLERQLEELRRQMQAGTLPDDAREFKAAAGDEGVSLAPPLTKNAPLPTFEPRSGTLSEAPAELTRTIAGEQYHFDAEAFFQTNLDLVPALIEFAIGEARGNAAIDLYCGVGLFTLPLARRFGRVVGIEANRRGTEFARRNLKIAELKNVEIVTSRVGDWLKERSRAFRSVDFLLLDPPRSGAENRDIEGILALHPARISYVSCDPATLARDLKKLIAGGYSFDSVTAFDMFPQTHHVETVVHLLAA